MQLAQKVNEVWSMDSVSDSLANGRRLKCLTVADDVSHECVDIATDFGISGQAVTPILDQAALFRGYPVWCAPTTGRSSPAECLWPGRSHTGFATY